MVLAVDKPEQCRRQLESITSSALQVTSPGVKSCQASGGYEGVLHDFINDLEESHLSLLLTKSSPAMRRRYASD